MSERYTAEEFAACYSLRGYGRKMDALKWLEESGMRAADESDFQRCYHALNEAVIRPRSSRYIALGADGWNPVDPEHLPNRPGTSYGAIMRRARRDLDALERASKRKMEE